jgi:hypothetical protein
MSGVLKFEKGDAARLAFAVLKARGYPVTPENLLLLGDEFQSSESGPVGGDASMASAFPRSLAISVGRQPSGRLAPGVLRLGIPHAEGGIRALEAHLRALAPGKGLLGKLTRGLARRIGLNRFP